MRSTTWAISGIQPCAALMVCSSCGEIKPIKDFSLATKARGNRIDILGNGHISQCRSCQNDRYINIDPRKKMLYAARQRARKNGIECTITVDDIVIPEICPVLGIPLFSTLGKGQQPPTLLSNSPSLDRWDNTKGYIPENIRVISMRANDLKSDATLEEMEAVVAYMRGETSPSSSATTSCSPTV